MNTVQNVFERPKYNAENVYKYMYRIIELKLTKRGVTPEISGDFRYKLGQVALWLAYDERFDGNLNKGLLIRGKVGTGKTVIVEALVAALWEFQKNRAGYIHAKDLNKIYLDKDETEIEKYKLRYLTVVDDMGCETNEIKNFGNMLEPFNDLFDSRYRAEKYTIVTTNLLPSEIKERYGLRIYDRIKETMNDFLIDGDSSRK